MSQWDAWNDVGMLKAVRDLCPTRRGGIDCVEISSRGKVVKLTYETRQKIDARLKQLREQRGGPR